MAVISGHHPLPSYHAPLARHHSLCLLSQGGGICKQAVLVSSVVILGNRTIVADIRAVYQDVLVGVAEWY